MATYKQLKVWQINQECIRESLRLMDILPKKYAFEHIGKQLFRAISSIGANVAEGQDSYQGKEFARYINIAIHSAVETDHWINTLQNLPGHRIDVEKLMSLNIEVLKMLKGLRNSIENKRG